MAEPLVTALSAMSKLHAANVTASSITAPSVTNTTPTGDGVFSNVYSGAQGYNAVGLVFYGVGTADQTFTAEVYGWLQGPVGTWFPVRLLSATLTLGTKAGVASGDVTASELMADTVVISGAATSANEAISPADNGVAVLKVDSFGCKFVEVRLAKGTATSVNALVKPF
jgi:hypothetical protein